MPKKILVTSKRNKELVDISSAVQAEIDRANWSNGVLTLFVPHTTAAVTINENADPTVQTDIVYALTTAFPDHPVFRHLEGNSDAHVMTSLTGSSELLIIHEGRPLLGTWQGIYLAEFDGPRTRQVILKFSAG
jgi:secondary thiamine-phosphate synthase enzyme